MGKIFINNLLIKWKFRLKIIDFFSSRKESTFHFNRGIRLYNINNYLDTS